MKKNKLLIIPILSCLAISCTNKESIGSDSVKPESDPSTVLSETTNTESAKELIKPDYYVSDVAATASVMVSGKIEGKEVDYVISSYPVIFASMANSEKKTNLSIYADVKEEFSKKYSTSGFPQAGLFIKSELLNDTTKAAEINSFLKTFDTDVADLVNGGTQAVSFMNSYSSDSTVQSDRFGFKSQVIANIQKNNSLAFINREDNPNAAELKKFSEPLSINIEESDLGSYYSSEIPSSASVLTSTPFSIITPKGAPSAAFARYASDTANLSIAAPSQVSSTFTSKSSDFIIFDSVNGCKLAKKNSSSYKLVRMVTYGNLYIVATGNDKDGKMDEGDVIVGYGENLVPDLAFKAVYSK